MDTILRVIFIIYIFTTFAVAGYLSKTLNSSGWLNFIFITGFIFYTIAAIVITIGHKTEERNVLELLIILLYPIVTYLLLFQKLDYGTKNFWVFQGFFLFLIITGGFILGLILSPFLAKMQNYSWAEILKVIKFGFNYIKNLDMQWFGAVMFSGLFLAFGYFSSNLILKVGKFTGLQKIEFATLLLLGVFIIARYSYRHTVFNLNKDSNLRNQYVKHNLLER